MSEAGEKSPHLDESERRQAAAGAPLGPLVIHEIVRDQGEEELARSLNGLAWSALAAGLSIGFSPIVQAYLQAGLPEAPWRPLVSGFGYSVGFLIVILGRQQLFTETTLTALIPTLTRPTRSRLLGTPAVSSLPGIFPDAVTAQMDALSHNIISEPFWRMVVTAGSAGWLIGLMVWRQLMA